MKYIDIRSCCMDGLKIAHARAVAWETHMPEAHVWDEMECAHLEKCPVCNPELKTQTMLQSLWGMDVKVQE